MRVSWGCGLPQVGTRMSEAVASVAPIVGEATALLPLEIDRVSYAVRGQRLIDDISLRITHPGVTVVMGPNGAGKSVLLRLLHGLLRPTSGRIKWHGQSVGESIQRRQALVFQRPVLLRRSALANIDFVLKLRPAAERHDGQKWLEHVGLGDKSDQPARRLSGGEQQRLAMARALALRPEVLFMDEPTASLDPASVAAIEALVVEAREAGTKVVFVTHDLGQAHRLADEVVFLHKGRLAEQSEAAQFFDAPTSLAAQDYVAGRLLV